MATLRKKIEEWGKAHRKGRDIRKVLTCMCRRMTVQQIADMFDCTPAAVRYWLQEVDLLEPKPSFLDRLNEMGYDGLDDFFTAPENRHGNKTIKQLAEETGFCYPTVSKWYKKFEESLQEKKKGLKDVRADFTAARGAIASSC